MTTVGTLVLLYCVCTAVAIAVRRTPVPYTVALVIVGLGLGSMRLVEPLRLTHELLFTFFLPGLLFEVAFHLDLSAFRRVWRAIAMQRASTCVEPEKAEPRSGGDRHAAAHFSRSECRK